MHPHPAHPKPYRDKVRILRTALGLYWLVLVVATHLPQISSENTPQWKLLPFDKTMHFLTFGGLAGWLCWNRFLVRRGAWANAALAMAVGAAYGVAEETTQPWFGRVRDIGDLVADLMGLAVGVVVAALLWPLIWPGTRHPLEATDDR